MFHFGPILKSFVRKNKAKSPDIQPKSIATHPITPKKNVSSATPSTATHSPIFATPLKINRLNGTDIRLSPRRNENLKVGEMKGENIIILGDKPFGIEPGYLIVLISNELIAMINKLRPKLNLTDHDSLGNFCKNQPTEAEKLFSEVKEKLLNGEHDYNVSLYMTKGDYNDPTLFPSHVSPPRSRLTKAGTIKKKNWSIRWIWLLGYAIHKKFTGNRSKVNRNNLRECLATDLARDYGLHAQEEFIILSTYEDNYPKIIPTCKWEPRLRVFDNCLAGDKGHKKYLVKVKDYLDGKPVFLTDENGYLFSDKITIPSLGRYWVVPTQQNDKDKVGSHGQNVGSVKNELFIFDTGQAYRAPNQLVDHLHDDCSIDPPHNIFIKNLSFFYDTKLSERMAGVLSLYQISDQKTRDEIFTLEEQNKIALVIDEYKKSFPSLPSIELGAEEARFDKYINGLKKLKKEAHNKLDFIAKAEYKKYAEDIKKTKNIAIANRKKMLHVFKERLQLSPEKVDLVDHLEKLCGKTSILSNDGKVILNHLRLLPNEKPSFWQWLRGIQPERNRVRWTIQENEQKIFLSAVASEQRCDQMLTILNEYLKHSDTANNISIQESTTRGKIILSCSGDSDKETQLKLLTALFNEDDIKRYKHQYDPNNHPDVAMPPDKKDTLSVEVLEHPREAKIVVAPNQLSEKKSLQFTVRLVSPASTILQNSIFTATPPSYAKTIFKITETYLNYSSTTPSPEKWLKISSMAVSKSSLKISPSGKPKLLEAAKKQNPMQTALFETPRSKNTSADGNCTRKNSEKKDVRRKLEFN